MIIGKSEGNPSHVKPGEVLNPAGKPRGTTMKKYQVKERLLKKYGIHPVDKLIKIAEQLEANGKFEEAADIWQNMLKYFEPTKKPVECTPEKTTPEESVDAAEETFKLLQELEQHGLKQTESGEGTGVESSEVDVPSETGPETDIPGHTKE